MEKDKDILNEIKKTNSKLEELIKKINILEARINFISGFNEGIKLLNKNQS
ncbi:hypothetical protein [Companilactobacillus metriopterae]|uniref:hypothetical protein n=1 Tax=Companilactobacillus metriopterae TaxID=1909267 RepID=UPI0013E92AC6|nr:hypothetical protein [Companilactobacillus metriopterae]